MKKTMPNSQPDQLSLFTGGEPLAFAGMLEQASGKKIRLIVTNNETVMLSFRKEGGALRVRLHQSLLAAGPAVVREIAGFLKHGKGPTPALRAFFRQHRGTGGQRPPRRTTFRPRGAHHDLSALFNELNDEYFGGCLRAQVTWGNAARRASVKTTLGSYQERTRIIRINPKLDRRRVPRYFVAYVLYHEMLHADLGVSEKNGRRIIHPPEFRRREMLFRDYQRARKWERQDGRHGRAPSTAQG